MGVSGNFYLSFIALYAFDLIKLYVPDIPEDLLTVEAIPIDAEEMQETVINL